MSTDAYTLRKTAGFSKAMWLSMPRTEAFGRHRKGKTKQKAWAPSKKGQKAQKQK